MRKLLAGTLFASTLAMGVPAVAAEDPPGSYGNVDFVDNVADTSGAVALNFLEYGRGRKALDVMMVSGTFGLKSYDISDPESPVLLDELPADVFLLPGDGTGPFNRSFWENEDMNVDQDRKLVFMARDPRAFDGSTSDPNDVGGVYIVDAANPRDMKLELPVGHTTTCINSCDFLWTGGPASNTEQAAEWPGGRPIFATDIRDLDNVRTSPVAIDTERNDGVTDYAHDVQVDSRGVAWVSGRGGVRGYWTKGIRWDPVDRRIRWATATNPVPFAGGGTEEAATPSKFIHNADRPVGRDWIPGASRHGFFPGELVLLTEEAFGSPTCDGIGVFAIATLRGSFGGQGWRSTPEDPFRLETVSTWSPTGEEGTDPTGPFCSAHYFDRIGSLVAYSWYGQGTRFLDISNPREPIQVAYFRPDGGTSFAPYFHEDVVYVADIARGVDIIKLDKGADKARGMRRPVQAPPMSDSAKEKLDQLFARFTGDANTSFICVIPFA